MAACLVPDFPAVNIALEHLGELDKQLRAEGVSFSPEASRHLSEIAEAIKELEASRKAVHEELEVETIETGKLRHQLMSQRDHISAEISAAVAAARDANAAELNQVQLETVDVVQEIESMENRRKLLEEQIILLLPEHQLLNASYTELIEQLNGQLSEKADMQITLNETRNEIQATREKIAQVHRDRKDLQENLISQRKECEETKEMLEKEIDETINIIQEQTKSNTKMHRELDVALAELVKKERRLGEISDHASLLERSLVRLKTSREKHEEQIKDKIETTDELIKQKELREKELQELRETLILQLLRLQENIRTVEREIEDEQQEYGVRLEAVSKVSSDFRLQREKEDDALADRSRLNEELENSKQRLDGRFASIAKYKLEIKAMEEEMKQLDETNRVSVELFQKNLVELEGQLVKEKKSRAEFEVEREELCLRLETLKEQHGDSVMKLCSAVSSQKKRHCQLTEEKKKLQEHEAMNDASIEELKHQISRAEEERNQTEIKYNHETQQLNMATESIAQAQLNEGKKLKDQESVLSEVEAQFDVDRHQHQALKQQTSGLKDRKSQLELSIQEAKERTAATLQPKEDLKQELQTSQEQHMELLHSRAGQISTMERGIYETRLMLEQVNMENSRLHLRIEQMKEDIVDARKEKEKHIQEMSWMKEEVQSIYRSLVDAWIKDKLATQESAGTDQRFLEAMRTLMLQVQERKQHVGDINSRLEAELKAMSTLLEITES